MTGKNIGDLLNAASITWGSFMGGFNLRRHQRQRHDRLRAQHASRATCGGTIARLRPASRLVPVLHVDGQSDPCPSDLDCGDRLYHGARTARPSIRPTTTTISRTSTTAVKAGNFPAVSYIKMPAFQDGHPGNSDPLDEQDGIVDLINFLQQQPDWKDTAVIIAYDDFRRLVRPCLRHDDAAPSFDRDRRSASNGPGKCGTGVGTPEPDGPQRQAGQRPLRSGHAHPVPGDLALRQEELCQPRAHLAGLDPAIHRGQLAERRASRRWLVRCHDRFDHGHVRLSPEANRRRCSSIRPSAPWIARARPGTNRAQ